MTVDDWGTLLQCQPCSRGELSRTRANKNCHLLRRVQQTFGVECECLTVCMCVLSLLPEGRHLISASAGRKQANMLVQRCAVGKNRYETFWFTRSDRTMGRPTLLCNKPSPSKAGRHRENSMMEGVNTFCCMINQNIPACHCHWQTWHVKLCERPSCHSWTSGKYIPKCVNRRDPWTFLLENFQSNIQIECCKAVIWCLTGTVNILFYMNWLSLIPACGYKVLISSINALAYLYCTDVEKVVTYHNSSMNYL